MIHPVFHVDLLTPYRETPMHGCNYLRPPPDLVKGEEEYEVECILDSRKYGRGRKLQYLVKWVGYPDSENQLVNKKDIHANQALKDFNKRNQDPSVCIRRTWVECKASAPCTPHGHRCPNLYCHGYSGDLL